MVKACFGGFENQILPSFPYFRTVALKESLRERGLKTPYMMATFILNTKVSEF